MEISCYTMRPYSNATKNECSYKNLRAVDLKRSKKHNGVYKLSYGQYGTSNYVCYQATRD